MPTVSIRRESVNCSFAGCVIDCWWSRRRRVVHLVRRAFSDRRSSYLRLRDWLMSASARFRPITIHESRHRFMICAHRGASDQGDVSACQEPCSSACCVYLTSDKSACKTDRDQSCSRNRLGLQRHRSFDRAGVKLPWSVAVRPCSLSFIEGGAVVVWLPTAHAPYRKCRHRSLTSAPP